MVALDDTRIPSVIAANVTITYRVFGTGRQIDPEDEIGALRRLVNRSTQAIGVREVYAVKDVSFVAHKGESIGLVGRNGSGKSTLLRAVAGVVPPTSGTIWLGGRASLLGIGSVLMPKLSGRRNIWIGAQALGMTPRQVRAAMDDIIEFAGIGEFIDLPMNSYSSGMAARLRFAVSTAVVPDILVVDEALSTGDAEFRERASARISEIQQEAGTIFMVSHNAESVKKMCQRAMWMDRGHLIMDGPAEPVADAYMAKYGSSQHKKKRKPTQDPVD